MRFALFLRHPKTDDAETGVATSRYLNLIVPLKGSATVTAGRTAASVTARLTDATLATLDLNATVTSQRTTRAVFT